MKLAAGACDICRPGPGRSAEQCRFKRPEREEKNASNCGRKANEATAKPYDQDRDAHNYAKGEGQQHLKKDQFLSKHAGRGREGCRVLQYGRRVRALR